MKRSSDMIAAIAFVCICWSGTPVHRLVAQARTDTASYAGTPREYRPFSQFENPYKEFFLDLLEYPGYGRHIPEPDSVETVKFGFIGPIMRSVAESYGGPDDVTLRVNQRQIRWDGYGASHLATLGVKMLQGALLAVEHANASGGYRGHTPFELVVRNDNGEWRSSGRPVVDLAYRDSVWAILGTVDGANSHILIRVALKAEIPVMNTADTDPTFVETNIPWMLRNITDDRMMCYLLADFAYKKLGLERIAALRAVNRYGRVNIDEFRDGSTRLGHPLVVELSYEEGDIDFGAQLERIKSLDVDGIFTYGNSLESALILKQMREMGMEQWFFGSDRMVTDEFLEIAGPDYGRVVAGYPYDPTSQDPKHIQFIQEFRQAYGEDPETYAAHAYDGMKMLIEATEKAGLNRALIRDELVAMNPYHGVTGVQIFDAVLSDRSPATLAVLLNGKFEFFSRQYVLSDDFEVP